MDFDWLEDQVGRLPKGEQAKLRRGKRGEGFWKIAAKTDADPREEDRLELLCYATANMEQGTDSFGAALYQAGYTKTRLNRLLDTQHPHTEARKAVDFLISHGQPADWSELENYLRYQNDRAREQIARSYYFEKYKDEDE